MEEDDRYLHDILPTANQKKFMAPDDELMELLWRNGQVVMHSQTHRKPPANVAEFKQAQKPEPSPKYGGPLGNSSNLMQEDETASWFQLPLDDSLEREFCSEFFCEMPVADATGADKLHKDAATEREREVEFGATEESNVFMGSASKHSNPFLHENMMPPPKSHATGSNQQAPSWRNADIINFSHFAQPMKADLGSLNGQSGQKTSGNHIQGGMRESSSMMTIGLSACGSNQIQNLVDDIHTFGNEAAEVFTRSMNKDVQTRSRERVQTNTYETTVTSSSGGSGSSFGRTGQQSVSNQSHKRKGRDGEEPECHSEEAEYESVEASKPPQRSASARRSRAAEVHNLSERRRRDRINEKMKALQELIPHCNKSDKASMLDEAIAYLKSLQLQVQIMWMGSAMAPMMFPGVQQYMSHMGMGMTHASMPSIHSPIQLPRVPLVNQSIIPSAPSANHTPACPSPALNPVNFPTQMQNIHLPESYTGFLGFPHMQQPAQAVNLYALGSHTVQPNQPPPPAGTSGGLPAAGAVPPERTQIDHSGKERDSGLV